MTTFRLWAPVARRARVAVGGVGGTEGAAGLVAMAPVPGRDGWWEAEVASAGPGTDYRFVLDDGPPLPDPRSPCQPSGVLGPSRLVDQSAFPWRDEGWAGIDLSTAVLYELHVGTFTPEGTFDAATGKLDHLVDLGVSAVELMPVAEFSGRRGWGYDGVDLFAPHHAYGGTDGLDRLVDACHRRGLGVIVDVVYNHLGPAGNVLGRCGPYFTSRYATPWGEAVNLDGPDSDEVRAFFLDNAEHWLRDHHCDGLRLDAVHAIVDMSATHLLEDLAVRVEELAGDLGRRLVLIAESDLNDPRLVRSRRAGGYGLDAQWNDDFHHALHAVLTGETTGYYADFGRVADVATALERGFVYAGRYSAYRRRRHGRYDPAMPGHRLVGYLQNHDQVGNRATGERSAALMSTGRLKVGAALVLTAPFVPLLFQGEEWAAGSPFQYFTDFEDAELARAVSEGRRGELASFGWRPADVPDPQDPATFLRSKLDWAEVEKEPHASLLAWHAALIRLRRATPDLGDCRLDRVRTRYDEAGRWLVVERASVTVAANVGAAPARLEVRAGRVALSSEPGVHLRGGEEGGTAELSLPVDSVAIVVHTLVPSL